MYRAIELIAQEMDRVGIKYSLEENSQKSALITGFGVNNGSHVRVFFISTDDNNDVAVRLFGVVNGVSEDKVGRILEVINECNRQYRYMKFVLDDERDINVEYDIPLKTTDDSVGEIGCEVFIRMIKIVEESYPKFMRVVWG